VQASRGARAYAGDRFLLHLMLAAAEEYPEIPVVLHQDHGNSPETCISAIDLGFTSVMMDGSLLEDAKTPARCCSPRRSGPRRCSWCGRDALAASANARVLTAAGLGADIDWCARESIVGLVPRLRTLRRGVATVDAEERINETRRVLTNI
jgi:hypothetical protein